MQKNNYVVIMAGGIGSRFWPLSRADKPKQFLDILGTGKSLIQLTFERFSKIVPSENILFVANEQYRDLIKQQIPSISDNQILGEPFAKNTAPCIAYATYRILKMDKNANIVVAPSDHLILDEATFISQIIKGFEYVEKHDAMLTLGIQPHRPDTGYGYIQYLKEKPEEEIFKVKTFTEKPNIELAEQFIESGDFLWNAGIFLWNVKSIKTALAKYLPDLNELFEKGLRKMGTEAEQEFISTIYPICENISIDYGLIEKADNVHVLPSEFGWSDLGTWKSLNDVLLNGRDKDENITVNANAILENSEGCLVVSENNRLIVLQGVKDLYVINTEDALLLCNKNQEQEVKNIVNELKRKFNGTYN
jgi:mannose-1-phosphate guanylyltransferase